jgi:hypothetical protein
MNRKTTCHSHLINELDSRRQIQEEKKLQKLVQLITSLCSLPRRNKYMCKQRTIVLSLYVPIFVFILHSFLAQVKHYSYFLVFHLAFFQNKLRARW